MAVGAAGLIKTAQIGANGNNNIPMSNSLGLEKADVIVEKFNHREEFGQVEARRNQNNLR